MGDNVQSGEKERSIKKCLVAHTEDILKVSRKACNEDYLVNSLLLSLNSKSNTESETESQLSKTYWVLNKY